MKLGIGIPTAEFARQAIFYDYFNMMYKPENSIILSTHGQSPARGRNMIIESALTQDCTHILFLDDDVLHPSDIVEKLLRHDKDLVTGVYPMRNFPHQSIIFDVAESDGRAYYYYPEDGDGNSLVPIVAAGLGACLVKCEVFEKMPRPWITLGELEKDHWCDDISFFKRFRDSGFQAYCDLSVQCGHMATVTVRNEYVDGKWMTTYDTGGSSKVNIPLIRETHPKKYWDLEWNKENVEAPV